MQQVPRESLLFVIRAFGGTASWEGEGAPFDESDESITHQVCLWFVSCLNFCSSDQVGTCPCSRGVLLYAEQTNPQGCSI